MANLLVTVQTLANSLSDEMLSNNTMCFITTNGVVIGKPISVNIDDNELSDIQDITKYLYGLSVKVSKEKINNDKLDLNLKETILIENAQFKLGNVKLNLRHLVLNVSQIVGFYAADSRTLEDVLDNLI